MSGCSHEKTEMIARRDGVDYVRCVTCGQVFEAEDLEPVRCTTNSKSGPAHTLSAP